jgi:hypothetical protein
VKTRTALCACAALVGAASSGCAATVQVTRTYTPEAAVRAQQETTLRPVAIVHDGKRVALPPDATLEPGPFAESNETGRIALRPADSVEMRGAFAPDETLPGGGRVESSRATGALVAGLFLFSVSYGPSAYVGFQSPRSSDRVLAVPVAGPWMDLARRPDCVPPNLPVKLPIDPCLTETAARIALAIAGVIEDTGALFTLVGLPSRTRITAGDGPTGGSRESRPHLAVVPTPGGLAAIGSF